MGLSCRTLSVKSRSARFAAKADRSACRNASLDSALSNGDGGFFGFAPSVFPIVYEEYALHPDPSERDERRRKRAFSR